MHDAQNLNKTVTVTVICVSVPVCLSVCLSVSMFVFLSVSLFVCRALVFSWVSSGYSLWSRRQERACELLSSEFWKAVWSEGAAPSNFEALRSRQPLRV